MQGEIIFNLKFYTYPDLTKSESRMKVIFMQNLKKCYLPGMLFQGAAREWSPQAPKPRKRK